MTLVYHSHMTHSLSWKQSTRAPYNELHSKTAPSSESMPGTQASKHIYAKEPAAIKGHSSTLYMSHTIRHYDAILLRLPTRCFPSISLLYSALAHGADKLHSSMLVDHRMYLDQDAPDDSFFHS